MRTFLGLFALLFIFASAAAWQGRLTEDLKRRQDQQRGAPPRRARTPVHEAPRSETLSAGWNTLVVGRPSGADPFFDPVALAQAAKRAWSEPSTRAGAAGRAERTPDRKDAKRRFRGRRPERVTSGAPVSSPAPLPRFEPDFQITVRAGDVLSKICQGHYRKRPDELSLHHVVGAVSRYNGLPSPDAIRAGDVIQLPDIARFVKDD